jgi:WD40 repeat protein
MCFLSRVILCVQLAAACCAATACSVAHAQEDNGASRSLSFQVHDPEAARERRLALIIGNAGYASAPLANPANDAVAMAAKLRGLGFEVMEKENATRDDMIRLSREFGNRLKLGGVGVFYYAGHGMQLNGVNYLLPVDSDVQDETELQSRAYDVNEMLAKMDAAKNRLNIIVLDACRNNPVARASRAVQYGLAAMQQGTGTIVAYATQPGATAADGAVGGNSLYTQQLLLALSQPGLKVEDVFKQVRAEVFRRSGGKQTPWENSSLIGEFYFNRGGSAQVAGAEPETPARAAGEIVSTAAGDVRTAAVTPQLQPPPPPAPLQANPVLVPRRLLDAYQLTTNISMPAPLSLALFSPDARRLALVTQDRQLRVWEIVTGSALLNQDGFESASASTDGRYITGLADNHSVNVVDLAAPQLTVRNVKVPDAQSAVALPGAQRLLVVAHGGAVGLYDFNSGSPVGSSPGKIEGAPHIEIAPTGTRALLWGGPESEMLMVDLATGKRLTRIALKGEPSLVRFSRDGALLLVALPDGAANVYRLSDGASQAKLAVGGGTATLSRAEFLGDGKQILGYVEQTDPKQGISHRLDLFDAGSGKLLANVAQGAAVTDLRYSPDAKLIYYSTADNTINVFELNTKSRRTVLTDATLAGFSADGQRVLAMESDGMRLYDARAFTPIVRLPRQTSVFLQPNAGGMFATTATDGTVNLWEFEHGDPLAQLKGHIDTVQAVVFAPGGKRLVSYGKGRTTKLWGLPEVQDLEKLKKDQFESSGDYTRRVAEWSSPYTTLVTLGDYNADAETFAVRVGDVTITLPTPRAEAKRFAGQREGILTGKLKVFDVEQLEITDAKLSRLP